MKAAVLLLALVALAPAAAAAVSIASVEAPERTAAARPFEVAVTLANDGAARTVYLFGALYDEGGACGEATGPRFRAFTHMVQEAVELPARSTTRYPEEGARWLHRYDAADASAAPEDAQLCVFVANASSGPLIDYETYATTTLSVRAENAAPVATFEWEPARPAASEDVAFRAEATDAEGDPVAFRWDFGHARASGRATATGAEATTSFYPAGSYVVTLTASDGIDEAVVARTIEVLASDGATGPRGDGAEGDGDGDGRSIPLPFTSALAAAVLVAALRRWPPSRSR